MGFWGLDCATFHDIAKGIPCNRRIGIVPDRREGAGCLAMARFFLQRVLNWYKTGVLSSHGWLKRLQTWCSFQWPLGSLMAGSWMLKCGQWMYCMSFLTRVGLIACCWFLRIVEEDLCRSWLLKKMPRSAWSLCLLFNRCVELCSKRISSRTMFLIKIGDWSGLHNKKLFKYASSSYVSTSLSC